MPCSCFIETFNFHILCTFSSFGDARVKYKFSLDKKQNNKDIMKMITLREHDHLLFVL